MIPEGLFQAQLGDIGGMFAAVELLEERQYSPNKGLGAAHFRGMTYRQIYEECIREYVYDFRLSDQSLLLFVKSGSNAQNGGLSFSYYECPVTVLAYREFVGSEFGLSIMDDGFDEAIAVCGDDLRVEYEQYVNSLDSKNVVTPIRYDYKANDYRAGVHPASHVHFGFSNEIRVGTRRIMNPMSFSLLIVRQRYPREWERLLSLGDATAWCRHVRDKLDEVDAAYWQQSDLNEVALH